jgi:hypothetical protein
MIKVIVSIVTVCYLIVTEIKLVLRKGQSIQICQDKITCVFYIHTFTFMFKKLMLGVALGSERVKQEDLKSSFLNSE